MVNKDGYKKSMVLKFGNLILLICFNKYLGRLALASVSYPFLLFNKNHGRLEIKIGRPSQNAK